MTVPGSEPYAARLVRAIRAARKEGLSRGLVWLMLLDSATELARQKDWPDEKLKRYKRRLQQIVDRIYGEEPTA